MKHLVVVFILSMPLVFGCNTLSKISEQQKQYQAIIDEYIKDHPVRIDTTTLYLKGQDSSSFYKAIADSLLAEKKQTTIQIKQQYRDTCTSAQSIFENGYSIGYSIGSVFTKTLPGRIDTLKKSEYPTGQINALQKINSALLQNYNDAVLKAEQNKKWFWLFIIACITSALLLTALLIKIFK